ncbi:MAG TPA: MarR family transcriptional regulator [Syntrophomonadaceae bacterium]|nr:MarR family transcriptional regulator [Syntrophomonadaceae bacterium]HNX27830.1 MarR family transcriptional regulator [Syntrophomonadaceae bacterium]HPR93622.1 MarR family transcriptional regulator [Syntrophomonadaceae bacterium]
MTDLNDFLCFNMRAAMKKIDRNLGQHLEPFGISIPQSFILKSLLEENGTTLKEIGNRTLIDSSSMTVLVDKLEKDKLVERQLDAQDRRAIRIFITDSGRELAEQVLEMANAFNEKLRGLIADENKEVFLQGVNSIINGLD